MRKLLIILLFPLNLMATNWYISAAGNDANTGTSALQAWRTIAKLNASWSSILPGDNIYFRRGDTFYGSIVVGKSGTAIARITISNFGTGELPVITGFTTVSSWSPVSSGIYKATVIAKYTANMVTINNIPQRIGRTPNPDATERGYTPYTAFSGRTWFKAPGIAGTDWSSAEVVARKDGYVLERDSVIRQSGDTLFYTSHTGSINPRNDGTGIKLSYVPSGAGAGLFLQKHIGTLDQFGEWYYKATTSTLNIFFGSNSPSAYTVKIATIDTLINIGTKLYININGLAFEGSNLASIYFADGGNNGNLNITDNVFLNSGKKAVFGWNTSNVLIARNTSRYSMSSAFDYTGRSTTNVVIRDNNVSQNAIYDGMFSDHNDMDRKAIYLSVLKNGVASKNTIDTTGYVAIQYQGDSINVDSNFINYFCYIVDDGGGIYTYNNVNGKGRKVRHNIIMNGIGAPSGNRGTVHAEGIYCDGETAGVEILNNTISNVVNRGIYLNDPKNIKVEGNLVFNCLPYCINKHFDGSYFNVSVKKNTFFTGEIPFNNQQFYFNNGVGGGAPGNIPVFSTLQGYYTDLSPNIDSNYNHIKKDSVYTYYSAPAKADSTGARVLAGTSFTYNYFKNYAHYRSLGFEVHSKRLPTLATSSMQFVTNKTDTVQTLTFSGFKKNVIEGLNLVTYNNTYPLRSHGGVVLLDAGTVDDTLIAPTLIAASGATVDASFVITFTDNVAWRSANPAIAINGAPLSPSAYTLVAGQLTISPAASTLLQTAGSNTVSLSVPGYSTVFVIQNIAPGTATKLAINTQPAGPAINGNSLSVQPVIDVLDQYNNVTTSTAMVTAAAGAGTWTLGGTAAVTAVAGTATFTVLTATSTTSVTGATISFSSGSLTGVTSVAFNITAPLAPRPEQTRNIIRTNKRI